MYLLYPDNLSGHPLSINLSTYNLKLALLVKYLTN